MKKALLVLSILILASLACQTLTGGTGTSQPPANPTLPPPVSSPTPVPPLNNPSPVPPVNDPTSVPSSSSGTILFQDDFSDTNSGWSDPDGEYQDGQYLLRAPSEYQDVWANPGLDLGDVSIEVDVTKLEGPDDNDFGLICRLVDDSNFYFFWVSSDGYQGIGKFQNGEQSLISGESMQPTSVLKAGTETNHVRADCIGSQLTLYANGEMLSTVTDTSFSSGDVGLIIGTFDVPSLSMLFDNFIVRAP